MKTSLSNPNFIQPRYDAGGFAHLPGRITQTLAEGHYDAVVLFLVDGFGWRFYEQFQEAAFLQQVQREGQAARLTSQFPSTTSAHMTTLHTGMPVGEHGVLEWNYYEPELDLVITPLLFSQAGTPERDTLKKAGVKPGRVFPEGKLYRELKKQGCTTLIFQHREYTPSTYSDAIFKGATAEAYKTLPEALVNLVEGLAEAKKPAYFMLYYDRIDALSHEYGPGAAQTSAEIQHFLMAMEAFFLKPMAGSRRKVLCLFTADHGQCETDPATTIYINRDKNFSGVEQFLRRDKLGRPIVPAGSCRDFFLYIQPGMVEQAQAFLAPRLEGRAEVWKVEEMIAAGYFGERISPSFRAHAGDLVILPYRYESVWWYEKDKFEQRYYGHHGGLTPEEMQIPLLSFEFGA
jgi:hypothetical protein